MDYDIPALDALTRAEQNLLAELGVFCSKMNTAATKMVKALGAIKEAEKHVTAWRMLAAQATNELQQ